MHCSHTTFPTARECEKILPRGHVTWFKYRERWAVGAVTRTHRGGGLNNYTESLFRGTEILCSSYRTKKNLRFFNVRHWTYLLGSTLAKALAQLDMVSMMKCRPSFLMGTLSRWTLAIILAMGTQWAVWQTLKSTKDFDSMNSSSLPPAKMPNSLGPSLLSAMNV